MIPDIKQEILLVTEEGREEEVITRLARVGYDFTIGYLKGGIAAWKAAGKELDQIESISVEETLNRAQSGEGEIIEGLSLGTLPREDKVNMWVGLK